MNELKAVAAATNLPITVRINGLPAGTPEIETALDHGAKIIMLPMARTPQEVETFLEQVRGRAKTLVQIETAELAEQCASLQQLEWDYAFIGLNDLMISRGGHWLWEPLYDGTVERIFGALPGRRLGFGGITAIGGGTPPPVRGAASRILTAQSELQFYAAHVSSRTRGAQHRRRMAAVQTVWKANNRRSAVAVENDHRSFQALLTLLRASAVGSIREDTSLPFSES